jgi:hypothetical protein
MAETATLDFIAAQLRLVLDEQRAMREEQRAIRIEQRRLADTVVGLSRSIEHIRDDLTTMIKAEIGGLFASLKTRLERRIAAEIDERLPQT